MGVKGWGTDTGGTFRPLWPLGPTFLSDCATGVKGSRGFAALSLLRRRSKPLCGPVTSRDLALPKGGSNGNLEERREEEMVDKLESLS